MTKTIKVGQMPGRIQEVAVQTGVTTVAQALQFAGLSVEDNEIKIDGVTTSLDTVLTASTNTILLTKKVKGNNTMTKTIKVGQMPGRIQEVSVEVGVTTVGQALEFAGLTVDDNEIKADGVTVGLDSVVTQATNTILLTKKVKGNNTMTKTIKVGQMPGRIHEVAVEVGTTTVGQALSYAGLAVEDNEIKVDGASVGLDTVITSTTNTILLTKKVKGNAKTIKVGQMPGRIHDVNIEEGVTTVAQALEYAGLSVEDNEIKVDGATASVDTVLTTSTNTILLTKKVKGNNNFIKVAQVPGKVEEVVVASGAKVSDVLGILGLKADAFDIKVDGASVEYNSIVLDNASRITLTKKVVQPKVLTTLPGSFYGHYIRKGTTIESLVRAAGFDLDNVNITISQKN